MNEIILDDLEKRLYTQLKTYLFEYTDFVFWKRNNKFRYRNTREVNQVLKEIFDPLYKFYPSLKHVFDENLTLLQHCTWVGMNVPWPVDPDEHIRRVIDNVMDVFNITVYANIRCEVIKE